MNDRYLTLTNDDAQDPPEVLRGSLWVSAIVFTFIAMLLLMGLGVQRGKMLLDERARAIAERERDDAYRDRDTAAVNYSEQIAKAQSAQATAENKYQAALLEKQQAEQECKTAEMQRDQFQRELAAAQAARSVPLPTSLPTAQSDADFVNAPARPATASGGYTPTNDEITNFVRQHLAKQMGAVQAQMNDYAEPCDFHDKPQASLQTILAEREYLAQHWPVRFIDVNHVYPQISVSNDATAGWTASVTFDWRWVFTNRSGTRAQGVYRDRWKLIDSAQGIKIVSEHSVDAATGRSRD